MRCPDCGKCLHPDSAHWRAFGNAGCWVGDCLCDGYEPMQEEEPDVHRPDAAAVPGPGAGGQPDSVPGQVDDAPCIDCGDLLGEHVGLDDWRGLPDGRPWCPEYVAPGRPGGAGEMMRVFLDAHAEHMAQYARGAGDGAST